MRSDIFDIFQIQPKWVKVDLFANKANHQEDLYCSKENSLWWYNLSKLRQGPTDILWANPPFSKLAHFVTKLAMEPTKVLVVHPDWSDGYWCPLLHSMTTQKWEIKSGTPIYARDRSNKPLKSPYGTLTSAWWTLRRAKCPGKT
jgi:hypothetical protein